MKTKAKRHWYKVGVRKEYFPRDRWPKDFTSYVYVYRVLAASRVDAIHQVWAEHGEQLLKEMLPDRKQVSLEADNPVTHMTIGRIMPVKVYERN